MATKFEADLPHCVRNVKEKNVLLFKFRCNIFIGVRKEMSGLAASETPCSLDTEWICVIQHCYTTFFEHSLLKFIQSKLDVQGSVLHSRNHIEITKKRNERCRRTPGWNEVPFAIYHPLIVTLTLVLT
jgi:hypothetical protein